MVVDGQEMEETDWEEYKETFWGWENALYLGCSDSYRLYKISKLRYIYWNGVHFTLSILYIRKGDLEINGYFK